MDYHQLRKHWAIWWILQYINKPFLKNSTTQEAVLNMNTLHHPLGTPEFSLQLNALEELRSAGAISYQQVDLGNETRNQFAPQYIIAPKQPLYDEWCKRYEQITELPTKVLKNGLEKEPLKSARLEPQLSGSIERENSPLGAAYSHWSG